MLITSFFKWQDSELMMCGSVRYMREDRPDMGLGTDLSIVRTTPGLKLLTGVMLSSAVTTTFLPISHRALKRNIVFGWRLGGELLYNNRQQTLPAAC